MLWLVGVCVLVVAGFVWLQGTYEEFPTALRHVAFNLVAVATTCGYMTQDFASWPMFAPLVMLMLSCYACNTGSTDGGIKMFRTLVLFRQAGRELMMLVHPQAVRPVRIGGHVVQNQIVFAVLAFVVLYFGVVVVLTFALLASGLDFISAFSAIIACINNMGPGLGVVGFEQLPGAYRLRLVAAARRPRRHRQDVALLGAQAVRESGELTRQVGSGDWIPYFCIRS